MAAKCIFALVLVFVVGAACRRHSPLIADDREGRNRAAECTFGKHVHEIGSSWFADLGPPFGVMYCIKCDCIRIQRKRRVVARVQCRNIKNECPKPSCDEPVLLPGRCCKSCPGDFFSPDVVQDINMQVNTFDEEEKSTKHFASLLTGRSSLVAKREDQLPVPVSQNKNNVVATGRFTFHRKNLYYSFYVSDKAARPRSLQFVDHVGNILEEFLLSGTSSGVGSLYQNVTRKVCGVWKRLPREYRRLLKDEKLFAVLVWGGNGQEFVLSGQIMRYVALGTELFSSLLEPAPGSSTELMQGAGATAIVSISSASPPSIHIAVVFNGIFAADDVADVPVNISLRLEEKQQVILEEIKKISKPAHELNTLEVSSPVTAADLRLLTRGRLVLSVGSTRHSNLRLSGAVVTRATCELFQTTLSSASSSSSTTTTSATTSATETTSEASTDTTEAVEGLAWLYLNSEGSLVYNVQIDNVKDATSPIITLVDIGGKRRTELEDLTPTYVSGWANGTLDRLGPRVLEPLYSGNLAVNVAIPSTITSGSTTYASASPTTVRGRLVPRPVADARDSPAPVLMKRMGTIGGAVGIGWMSVDYECRVHYDIALNGMTSYEKAQQLYLEVRPMMAKGAPVTTKLLEEFRGGQVEDTGNELLLQEELVLLDSGVAFLETRDKETQDVLFRGAIKHIKVPPHCLSLGADNDVPTSILDRPQVDAAGEVLSAASRSCYHGGRFYEEGEDWQSSASVASGVTVAGDPCTSCFCQNGRVRCDVAVCPMSCSRASATECCPPCANTTTQSSNTTAPRGCVLGKQFHSAGSKWHPFLVPIGFDRCTECHCNPTTLEAKCTRTCPDVKMSSDNDTYLGDGSVMFSRSKSSEEILLDGGCRTPIGEVIENNKEFSPRIMPFGEYKCVVCKCKNGTISCERVKCSKSQCANVHRQRRSSESKSTDKCCPCKRYRRHHAHRTHQQS